MPSSVYPGTLDSDSTIPVLDDILVTHITTGNVTATDTTIPVTDASAFPPQGYLAIYNQGNILGTIEYVSYSGKTATSFTGVVRGINTRFPAKGHALSETVSMEFLAEHYQVLKSATQSIETTLGTNPQRSFTNVDLRIAALEAALAGVGATVTVTATTNITLSSNTLVFVEGASQLDLRLPPVSAKGDTINIVGTALGNGYNISQNTGQFIIFSGNGTAVGTERTTTGTSGSCSPSTKVSTIEIVCSVANTVWTVLDAKGGYFNLT